MTICLMRCEGKIEHLENVLLEQKLEIEDLKRTREKQTELNARILLLLESERQLGHATGSIAPVVLRNIGHPRRSE